MSSDLPYWALFQKASEKANIKERWRGVHTYGVYYVHLLLHQNTACVAALTNSHLPEKKHENTF